MSHSPPYLFKHSQSCPTVPCLALVLLFTCQQVTPERPTAKQNSSTWCLICKERFAEQDSDYLCTRQDQVLGKEALNELDAAADSAVLNSSECPFSSQLRCFPFLCSKKCTWISRGSCARSHAAGIHKVGCARSWKGGPGVVRLPSRLTAPPVQSAA